MSDRPREQLAALLVEHAPMVRPLLIECRGCAVSFGNEDAFADHVAERIAQRLIDQGWRPPARVVETVEELNALPDGTVILDADEEFHCLNPYGPDEPRTWYPAWLSGNAYAQDFGQAPELPATVLHTPENGDTQ